MAYTPKSLQRGYFSYTSDDSTLYELATSLQNGVTVNAATVIAPGSLSAYPRGWTPRHIYGFNAAGPSRTKVPIFDPANTLWLGGVTTFTKDGITYTIEGKIGERRTYKGG
jgi:hypothetical protein